MTNSIRVVFMGTPEYAVPALQALRADPRVEVVLVATQPDRPQGRGRKLKSPPVKLAADEIGYPVLQVSTLRDPATRAILESAKPDLIVVAAFGIILGAKTLELPRLGCVNLHASLLPAYRGANPIAAAIAMGETETGITLMQMDRGLDTGPIIAARATQILPDDTTASLTTRLAGLGADLLTDSNPAFSHGRAESKTQPNGATVTRPMTKDDGWIDWSRSAKEISDHVRAMIPWPRAWTTLPDGTRMQVLSVSEVHNFRSEGSPGTLLVEAESVKVVSGSGAVCLSSVQFPGGTAIRGRAVADRLYRTGEVRVGLTRCPSSMPPLVIEVDPG